MAPDAHASHGGSIPRAAHARTGSITTRSFVSRRVPTISCPGMNGIEMMGEK
jgi:hypothetical protein